MENNFGLPKRTIDELTAYFSAHEEIRKVVIFGSRAKGNFHNGSDIDFAVWKDDSLPASRIWGDLDNLPTPYKFDVVDYESLTHEGMKNSIDRDGIIFYQRD